MLSASLTDNQKLSCDFISSV